MDTSPPASDRLTLPLLPLIMLSGLSPALLGMLPPLFELAYGIRSAGWRAIFLFGVAAYTIIYLPWWSRRVLGIFQHPPGEASMGLLVCGVFLLNVAISFAGCSCMIQEAIRQEAIELLNR